MKAWQKGIDIDVLLELEGRFKRYNQFCLSPFAPIKKHIIADMIDKGRLKYEKHWILSTYISKVSSNIKVYHDVVCGRKQVGDRIIQFADWIDDNKFVEQLMTYNEPCWMFLWAEDSRAWEVADKAGFEYVGSQISSFGDIKAVFFRNEACLFPRDNIVIPEEEFIGLQVLPINIDISPALEILNNIDYDFTDHYSNYNKKHTWSALSFRGYLPDPGFITKPSEMNKKWNKEHEFFDFKLQDTQLRKDYPQIDKLFDFVDGEIHRIRFMKLSPGGGELERHTDLVDKDSGIGPGKVMRLHFPVITNPDVEFTIWNLKGIQEKGHMKLGECVYIDTRKPHRAINNGDSDRIHLVVDVEATNKMREMVLNGTPLSKMI